MILANATASRGKHRELDAKRHSILYLPVMKDSYFVHWNDGISAMKMAGKDVVHSLENDSHSYVEHGILTEIMQRSMSDSRS